MTDELKAFRVLLVPVFLIIVFFVITPRMCARKTVAVDQEQPVATTAAQPASGLHIEGAPTAPVQAKQSTYPPGLDAARIQYLVEINSKFSEPATARLFKIYDPMSNVTQALLSLHYIEKNPDGTVAMTRDGVMNLSATDEGPSWIFPIAKRTFDAVTYVSRVEDDKYDATISWHYDPNPAGVAMHVDRKKMHSATAEFVGSAGSWDLSSWIAAPDQSL